MRICKIIKSMVGSKYGKHYVSPKTRENTQKLLELMNNETKYKENASGTSWQSDILTSIKLNKKVKFTDWRMYISQVKKAESKVPDCSIHIGKNMLLINSSTGEIVAHKISFFKSFHCIIHKAENSIKQLLEHYNNPNIVQKNSFKITGYTQKGFEKISGNK